MAWVPNRDGDIRIGPTSIGAVWCWDQPLPGDDGSPVDRSTPPRRDERHGAARLDELTRERCDKEAIARLGTALQNAGYRREV